MKINESIFKAYDIRGIYPTDLNEEIMYAIGQGYLEVVRPAAAVVVGRDIRVHSEKLAQALITGLTDAGIDVIDVGIISTEMLYFTVGNYGYAGGIQVTASHNPAEWNGCKMVKKDAEPISGDTGIVDIKNFVKSGQRTASVKKGTITKKDILDDFCHYILTWINPSEIKPVKLVFNPNFGFEGEVLKRTIEIGSLPLDLVPLNAEPDGTFPKGRPDPFIIENRIETMEIVKSSGADLGVAWDADADRVFFCTDEGIFLEPYYTNTLLIAKLLKKYPGGKILYDPRNTWALIDATAKNDGTPILERVGHAFIKARMRKENAIFAGESSGHTYYRDFWFADTGMIPLLQILEILSESGKKLSELVNPVMIKYPISGEINFVTEKAVEIMTELEEKYSDSKIVKIDGLSCEYSDWRFNLRSSNTEPLLRLNMEAKNQEFLNLKKAEIVNFIEENK